MSPTLSSGDIVLVRWGAPVHEGEVVLVRWPGLLSVKRAVHQVDTGWHVRGDNQFGSTDSRTLGPAEVLAVIGWRVWPRPRRLRRRF